MFPFLDLPLVAGALLAWSLAAPPGPVNALIAQAGARRGFWAGWRYGLGAIGGDLTMLALTGWGVVRVVERFPWLRVAFAIVGASLLAYFALTAWRSARRPPPASEPEVRAVQGWREFGIAYVVVTTSPFNWAWWLTAGSSMITLFGWITVLGFVIGLILWTIFWAWLAAVGGARVKRFSEYVGYAAAVVLAVTAVVMAWYGVTAALELL